MCNQKRKLANFIYNNCLDKEVTIEYLGSKDKPIKDQIFTLRPMMLVVVEAISQQLAIINEQYAEQNSKRSRTIRYVKSAVCIIVVLGILAAVLPQWKEIWNNFGRNLYHGLNG